MRRRRKRAQSEYINVATIEGMLVYVSCTARRLLLPHKEHVLDGDAFPILLQTTSFFFSVSTYCVGFDSQLRRVTSTVYRYANRQSFSSRSGILRKFQIYTTRQMEAKELGASRSELPRMRERWCARKFVGSSPAYKSAGQMCLRLYRQQPAVKSSFPSLLIHVNFFRSYSAQVRFFFRDGSTTEKCWTNQIGWKVCVLQHWMAAFSNSYNWWRLLLKKKTWAAKCCDANCSLSSLAAFQMLNRDKSWKP